MRITGAMLYVGHNPCGHAVCQRFEMRHGVPLPQFPWLPYLISYEAMHMPSGWLDGKVEQWRRNSSGSAAVSTKNVIS